MSTLTSRRLAPFVLILLAFALRLYRLDYQSLWRDEVDTLRFATRALPELAQNLIKPGENGPLYFVAMRPWLMLAGPTEFALRFPSVVVGTLAVPAIYILAKRLAGGRAALVAALLAATAPYLVWYGQEAKMYAALTLLVPLALWWTTEAARRGGLWRWAVLYATTSLALYTHILAALIIPVQAAWLILWPSPKSRRDTWLTAGLYLAALILPYLPLARWQAPYWLGATQSGGALPSLSGLLGVLAVAFGRGVTLVRAFWQLLPALLAFLCGIFLWTATKDRDRMTPPLASRPRVTAMLLIWLFLPVLLIIPISLGLPVLAERYLIWVMPAFLILAALGVVALSQIARPLGATLLVAVLALNLTGIAAQATRPIKADYRSAMRYVNANLQTGDTLLYQIPYARYAMTYYDARQSAASTPGCLPAPELWFDRECGRGVFLPNAYVDGPYTNNSASEASVAEGLTQALDGKDAVWLIASEEALWDERGLTRAWLETHGRATHHADFTRISVTRYNLTP